MKDGTRWWIIPILRETRTAGQSAAATLYANGSVAVRIAAMVVLVGACANPRALAPEGKLPAGTWGGDNAAVMVTESATHVHVGCTNGDMPATIQLDAAGRFTVSGNYLLRAYPVAMGPSLPAEFDGRVNGRTLALTITVNDTIEKKTVRLGPVTVTLGREPRMGPCPICRLRPAQ